MLSICDSTYQRFVMNSIVNHHSLDPRLEPWQFKIGKLFLADDRTDLVDGAVWVCDIYTTRMLAMSTNNTLKECWILPHSLRGERKWQIQGIWVGVYEKNTKSDRVWGTV